MTLHDAVEVSAPVAVGPHSHTQRHHFVPKLSIKRRGASLAGGADICVLGASFAWVNTAQATSFRTNGSEHCVENFVNSMFLYKLSELETLQWSIYILPLCYICTQTLTVETSQGVMHVPSLDTVETFCESKYELWT